MSLFNPNGAFMFVLAAIVIVFVIVQSVFFLIRAYKRGIEIGMTRVQLNRTIISTAVFTIAPAIAILIGVITLAKFLGVPFPTMRLCMIGAITYELPAATTTAKALGISSLSHTLMDAKQFTAIAWVMSLGIIPGMILIPLLLKKMQKGIVRMKNTDSKWGDLFLTSLFLGMISAFLGMIFSGTRQGLKGWIPVFVMLFSALCMAVIGLLVKKFNMKWLETYALGICMVSAMIFAAVITPIIV